jgi:S1-C subfamily serine protease
MTQNGGSVMKVVISASEVDSVTLPADPLQPAKVRRPIPIWARLIMLPLILVMPLLAIVALVMRIALRATPPRTQQAWHSYLMALLIASSLVSTLGVILLFSYVPLPPQAISLGLPELDERSEFPALPVSDRMTGKEVAHTLKPLVMVASPATRRWFGRGDGMSNLIGAAVLIHADAKGYLFATARHVAGEPKSALANKKVLLTTGSGGWAGADVVGWHKTADVALLWMARHDGSAEFAQPLALGADNEVGGNVFVIGHPEGLNFTISSGIISRLVGDTVQISAPVSPGNSGGPVYDDRGDLVGVVTAKMDRSIAPNAENLSFAAGATLFSRTTGWEFASGGQQHFEDYLTALKGSTAPDKKVD